MKPRKIFKCSCAPGFDGDFCEFKTGQDHLLYSWDDPTIDNPWIRHGPPLVFNADGKLIAEHAYDEYEIAFGSCSTMLNGEAIIIGGMLPDIYQQVATVIINEQKYHLFKILVVSECTLKRLGDLSFNFVRGTCGTFMIDSSPRILLCFQYNNGNLDDRLMLKKCRSLTRKNDVQLSDIENFVFDSEFELDTVAIPDSTYNHEDATIANYQGFPLILGDRFNNKLEMLNTKENPPSWVEYEKTNYPYSDT